MLDYSTALMRSVFGLEYKKPFSGEIRLPDKSYHVNYSNLLFLSVLYCDVMNYCSLHDNFSSHDDGFLD
jgi:hypothetical protein